MPSEIDLQSPDRRTRKRDARRDQLLDQAADLVEEAGIEGLTMAALAERADYAPASLYTYFPSRSALLASLQRRALASLHTLATHEAERWDVAIAQAIPTVTPVVAALARLWSFSDLFLAAPDRQPREFRLQQRLLVTRDGESTEDAATVVPAAMAVLELPRALLADAATVGALDAPLDGRDPLDQPLDGALVRTLAWVVALNGALLTDNLTTGLPSTGVAIGHELTGALLAGWGAAADALATARALADGWATGRPDGGNR